MMQPGLFDWQNRFEKLDKNGDPLGKLNQVVPWNIFRPALETLRDKDKKSNAGAKPYDVIVMFKILILQSLYNLSDEATEYQVLDRLSFMRFLGLRLGSRVPDAKTIWLFREQLTEAGLAEELFRQFETVLEKSGFAAKKGQIIDASIVQAPKQRNSREENARIKQGEIPQEWGEAKKCQKDSDAQWTKRNGRKYYGYKNHVNVDVKHKLIRSYAVTDASVHDSRVFDELLKESNTSAFVYADSAYRSKESIALLKERRAKIRCRIEHVFGVMAMMAGSLMVRTIGIIRASTKIGLRNLAYNIKRYGLLAISG
jgi:IS5 family transposase